MLRHTSTGITSGRIALTDIEIVRLCAEAAGYALEEYARGWRCKRGTETHCVIPFEGEKAAITIYWPLTNKAQAMDLVIALKLDCLFDAEVVGGPAWEVSSSDYCDEFVWGKDLLRAICECAADMQQTRVARAQ